MTLKMLVGADLVAAAKATTPSSLSLDNWLPSEITTLALWFPAVFSDLAKIYNKVEEIGCWPQQLMEAFTSLIPKDETVQDIRPIDFRPITVLSSIYRLYAKARFSSLLQWQEQWVTESVFGCRPGHSADNMAFQISMDLESEGFSDYQHIAGVSYDCRKAFDLIPIEIAMETMRIRGCHPKILRSVKGLYNGLRRVFRLHGAAGEWWSSSNGLVQGDPISMVMLHSLVTCVVETTNRIPLQGISIRSFADDLSSVVIGQTSEEVKDKLRSVHAVMRGYVAAGCGELNNKKCFTFGDESVSGLLHHEFPHMQQFRIVGGSLTVQEEASQITQLEQKRWNKWKSSLRRIRRVPYGWHQRAKMMLATQAQACFAQGTHALIQDRNYLKQIRSEVMRSLWNMDAYSCSPLLRPQNAGIFTSGT